MDTDTNGGTTEGEEQGDGSLETGAMGSTESGSGVILDPPSLTIRTTGIKQLELGWTAVDGAEYYQVFERRGNGELVAISDMVTATLLHLDVALHLAFDAEYIVRACQGDVCVDSAAVPSPANLADSIGYFKASNSDAEDQFGWSIALSADGNMMAVGAPQEDSEATGVDGDPGNGDTTENSGAAYVFRRDADGRWVQDAYLKAIIAHANLAFGYSLDLNADGTVLAVGSQSGDDTLDDVEIFVRDESLGWLRVDEVGSSGSDSSGFGNTVSLNASGDVLAVGAYEDAGETKIFRRIGGTNDWIHETTITTPSGVYLSYFGCSVDLNAEGDTLVIGAYGDLETKGAAYVYRYQGANWALEARLEPDTADYYDYFGWSVSVSSDGAQVAVGAHLKDDEEFEDSGSAYIFRRSPEGEWSRESVFRAPNADTDDRFGYNVALSGAGDVLAIGAYREDGSVGGFQGDQTSNGAVDSGAVYLYERVAGAWTGPRYLKAPIPSETDYFGGGGTSIADLVRGNRGVALNADGRVLAVSAWSENGGSTQIRGTPDQTKQDAGAAYVY